MASGRNKRQATLDANTAAATANYNAAAQQQLKPTDIQNAADTNAMKVLNNTGDWANNSEVNWSGGNLAMLKNEQAMRNRGAYTFGANSADPNLLAALNSQEEANAGQSDALGFESAISNAKANAQNYALGSAGLTSGRVGSVLGPSASLASGMSQQATQFSMQPGIWSQVLLTAMANAKDAAKAASGAP